jgi:Tol biopolymer transport system component
MIAIDGERREQPILNGTFNEQNPEVSPDGRWLAYQSNESGRIEIYQGAEKVTSRGSTL